MTKRERVLAALRGEPVDRVPIAFWLHNFATENSAEGLSEETLRLARTFDWDFLKPGDVPELPQPRKEDEKYKRSNPVYRPDTPTPPASGR